MPGIKDSPSTIRVRAPARLHAGFLDLHGGLGRRFGSIGITLEEIATVVRGTRAAALGADGPSAERARRGAERLHRDLGLPCNVHLTVEQAIPEHVGLGSGTQMDLAVAAVMAGLAGHPVATRDFARRLGRGARSGIGIGAFEDGGVLVDGGVGAGGEVPPVVARAPFPEGWRILLLHHDGGSGLHGPQEVEAFRALPPFPAERAGHLCRLVLMVALPALAETDLARFGQALGEMQRIVGDHFAPAQGGRFTSPLVGEVLSWLERRGVAGVGQSSWGPTGFAVVNAADAEGLAADLRRRWDGTPLRVQVCRGRNAGAEVYEYGSVAIRSRA